MRGDDRRGASRSTHLGSVLCEHAVLRMVVRLACKMIGIKVQVVPPVTGEQYDQAEYDLYHGSNQWGR